MKREDWIEYFEVINGRLPEDEEIDAALANGEFQVEQAVEVAPVPEEVVAAPVADSALEGLTEEVGSVEGGLASTAPETAQPTPPPYPGPAAAPAQKVAAANFLKYFWDWFLSALKKPSLETTQSALNGWVFFGLLSLFLSLPIFILIRNTVGVFYGGYSDVFGSSLGTDTANPIGFGTFIITYLMAAVLLLGLIVAGFAAKRLINREQDLTFSKAIDLYARYAALPLVIVVVASLFALLQLTALPILLLEIALGIIGYGALYSLVAPQVFSKQDKFYRYLLAVLVYLIVVVVTFLLMSLIGASVIETIISNLYFFS